MSRPLDARRLLPELTPWHRDALAFIAACFVGGAATAVLGALVDRRLRHG